MSIIKHWKARKAQATTQSAKAEFAQERKRGGLLVTDELAKALEGCKLQVSEIAADCRRRNRKFRDIEFDLEQDKDRCLNGLKSESPLSPSDVQRVTQIFEKPSFFVDGADSNDIVQGMLGDCWFLSALATMSTSKGLVEKFCVARDEQVGVYGFIFFRDTAWVTVIIDDLLYTSIPKFEELKFTEKLLYHHDKQAYNESARKTGKSLYFAKSGTHGETWVPLIEKAYAKLHGNYAALIGGEAGEAIEDLTGGVTSFISTKDILDVDRFWKDELLKANSDRLFGCAFDSLDSTRSGDDYATVNGLYGAHAYSVLRAVEYNGKRFLVIRNPWGKSEWTGPWSDGSKEWTPEWLAALPKLGHSFGDDGQFIMEYKDFMENWDQVDRTLLFDSSWTMSAQWLRVTARSFPSAWGFGDVSFTISIPSATSAVIVLSKIDDRYFNPIAGFSKWSFDFVVFKKGETTQITSSSASMPFPRSVNTEIYLEAGEYVLHVRLDRWVDDRDDDWEDTMKEWQERTYARVLTEQARSRSIASNFDKITEANNLPIPISVLAGTDLSELKAQAAAAAAELEKEKEALGQNPKATTTASAEDEADWEDGKGVAEGNEDESSDKDEPDDAKSKDDGGKDDGESKNEEKPGNVNVNEDSESEPDDDDTIYLGLRVYTNKQSPAKISGQLRHETGTPFSGLASGSL